MRLRGLLAACFALLFLCAVRQTVSVYADSLCTVEYEETKTTGATETTKITVHYKDDTGAQYRWRIVGWKLTAGEVTNFSIPEDAPAIPGVTESDNGVYVLDADKVFATAVSNGSIPDYQTGEIYAYAQPVIAVDKLVDGEWMTKDSSILSLEQWVSAGDWKGTGEFKQLYNLPVKLRTATDLTIRKETTTGDTLQQTASSVKQQGAVQSLSELGISASESKNGNKYVLCGISIKNAIGRDGSLKDYSVRLLTNSFGSTDCYRIKEGSNLIDAYGNDQLHGKNELRLSKDFNGLYNLIANTQLRVGSGMHIVAEYVLAGEKISVRSRSSFHQGEMTDVVREKEFEYFLEQPTKSITKQLSDLGITPTKYHNGSNKWQLDFLTFAEQGTTTSGGLLTGQGTIKHNFSVTTKSASAWQREVENSSPFKYTIVSDKTGYVIEGKYVLYAPQVELSYYRDPQGKLHLFSVTSGGNQYADLDGMLRHKYGTKASSSFTMPRFIEGISVEGCKRDLVLMEAYAYEGPGTECIHGYLSDTKNCWTSSEEPTGGQRVQAVYDGITRNVWNADSRESALKDAFNNVAVQHIEATVKSVPGNPLIYVSIYEASPSLYSVSYVTASKTVNGSTTLTKYAPEAGSVYYNHTEYKTGTKLALPIGTESVEANLAYAQDGLDTGLHGYMDLGAGMLVYCSRYAWVTGKDVEKVLSLGDSVSFSTIQNTVGVLESTSLGGKLYLEDQQGLLLKIYTPEVRYDGTGIWKVNYLDCESSNAAGTFSAYKGAYERIQRAQLSGDYRVTIENSTMDGTFLSSIASPQDGRELDLVNVGVSRAAKGYTRQRVDSSLGGNTLSYHDPNADREYAAASINDLEKRTDISWKTNPYSARNVSELLMGNYNQWFSNQFPGIMDTRGWQWYVYKYAKSFSTAVVLEGEDGYYTEEPYSIQDLSAYTDTYQVSLKPFIEHKNSGSIYYLDRIYYGYLDEGAEVITEAELERLENSVSFLHHYHGGRISCTLSKTPDGSNFRASVSGNTNVYSIDGKQLRVVGVYRQYQVNAPVQGEPDIENTLISYRDTRQTDGTTTPAAVSPASSNTISGTIKDERFVGAIWNDIDRSTDDYMASAGIPTTEYLRASVSLPKYLVDIDFNKSTVTIEYEFAYHKAFCAESVTTDVYGNTVTVYDGVCSELRPKVKRSAVNYSLYGATVWYPSDATLRNYAFPNSHGGKVTFVTDELTWINDSFGLTVGEDSQFLFKNFKSGGKLDDMVVSNGVETVTSLSGAIAKYRASDYQKDAESRVDPIKATNQQVEFHNGEGGTTVLLTHTDYTEDVSAPEDAPEAAIIPMDIIYQRGDSSIGLYSTKNNNQSLPWGSRQKDTGILQIDKLKKNGTYETDGTARYVTRNRLIYQHGIPYKDVANGAEEHSAESNGICFGVCANNVRILTPTLVNAVFSDSSAFDQSIRTDAGYTLVLDKMFTISTSALGRHCGLPGYGFKNYDDYLATMQSSGMKAVRVSFPFPVIKVSRDEDGGMHYDAVKSGQLITVGLGSTTFYLPTFVEEDDLLGVFVKAYAFNVSEEYQTQRTEYGINANLTSGTEILNSDDGWSYVAVKNFPVSVKGRLYGISIIDVGDYPLWEGVFRTEDQKLTGKEYRSGLSDHDGYLRGILSNDCFPIVAGNHPSKDGVGFMRSGYSVRFRVETVGSMYSADDLVAITPKFYWVDKDGKNRTEVNLYYDVYENGITRSILIGSKDDKKMHTLSFAKGGFGISIDSLERTANILGYQDVHEFTGHESPVFRFSGIQLNQFVRNFTGREHSTSILGQKVLINEMVEASGSELGISNDAVDRSVQQWYGMYYLPSGIHVTEYSDEEVRKYCRVYDYKETDSEGNPLWKSDGYLIVNFNIDTVNCGQYSLTYDADRLNGSNEIHYDAGSCDMWDLENSIVAKKSSVGVDFSFEQGDFLVYDVKDLGTDNAANDFVGSGTH